MGNEFVGEFFHGQHVFHHTAQTHVSLEANALLVLEKPQLFQHWLHVLLKKEKKNFS